MIVCWKGDGAKVIPMIVKDEIDKDNHKTIVGDMIVLAPGYNDIADNDWANVREVAKKDVENGRIIEEWIKAEKAKDAKDAQYSIQVNGEIFIPAMLRDINRPRVISVVTETYHVPTLKKWMDEELRQDVRVEIMRRLDVVNKTGE